MKKTKKLINGILFLFGILFLLSFVSASYIGISPANVFFRDVLRGGYSERIIIITTDSQVPVGVEIQPRGDITEWINFSSKKFEVSKDNPYTLTIYVIPPADIPNGNYTGFARFKTIPTGKIKEGYATGIIQTVLDLSITVEITDLEILSCSALNFDISSAEKGDSIILKTEILNKGNIRLTPKIRVDIWDQEQMRIVKTEEFQNVEIIPTVKKIILNEISSEDLEINQYWAEISVIECYASNTLTFDVLEPGSLKSLGELTKILVPPWNKKGDTLMIQAYFQNIGEKRVDAQFKGTLSLDGKIIEILESEKSQIEIGEEETFKFYFTPKKQGKYIVTGKVFYDKKRTFEKSAVFNVTQEGFSFLIFFIYFAYFATVVGIIILIYKIRKEKRKIQNKMERLKK